MCLEGLRETTEKVRIFCALTDNQAVHHTYTHHEFMLNTVQNRTAVVWEEIQWCNWSVPTYMWDGIITCSCASTLTHIKIAFGMLLSVSVVKTEFANIMSHNWYALTKYWVLIAQSVYWLSYSMAGKGFDSWKGLQMFLLSKNIHHISRAQPAISL